MRLAIDSEVFKLKDSRITAVSSGRLSVQALAHMIRPGDYIIFRDGIIYALTEAQYYAAQLVQGPSILSKDQFEEILSWDPGLFSQQDAKKLAYVRTHKANCSKCQYNTYKSRVLDIVRKYPELLHKLGHSQQASSIPPYPEVIAPVKSKVTNIFPHFFAKVPYDRKPCLDCVQKHISVARAWELLGMAYVKGCEAQQGYPEHFALALANLEEAYEECPKDCEELRDLIMFCIGKSKHDNQLFLPLQNILYIIQLARAETSSQEALDENEADQAFSLQFSKTQLDAIGSLPVPVKGKLMGILEKLLEVEYSSGTQQKALYQGYMATLADEFVNYIPAVSNILRNRRLMFKAAPQLVQNTEYDCKDLKEALIQPAKVSEKDS